MGGFKCHLPPSAREDSVACLVKPVRESDSLTPARIRAGLSSGKTFKSCRKTNYIMKTTILSATIALPLAFALASCSEKTETEETTEENVSSGAEKTAEGMKQMADEAAAASKEAAEDTKDAAANAADAVQDAAKSAAEAVEEAASDAADKLEE